MAGIEIASPGQLAQLLRNQDLVGLRSLQVNGGSQLDGGLAVHGGTVLTGGLQLANVGVTGIWTPYRVRVILSANQPVAFNPGFVVINFDVVDYDPSHGWDAAHHKWVVPATGYYWLSHQHSYNFGAQSGFFEGSLSINGANPLVGTGCSAQIDNNNSWMQGCSWAGELHLNAGDTVAVITSPQMTAGGATLIGDGSARTASFHASYRGT